MSFCPYVTFCLIPMFFCTSVQNQMYFCPKPDVLLLPQTFVVFYRLVVPKAGLAGITPDKAALTNGSATFFSALNAG